MQSHISFSNDDVAHIATLANIPVTDEEKTKLAAGFTITMKVVDDLKKADTTSVEPTHQVTALENILREDAVDEKREFSQDEALRNAKQTYKGFFVVDQVIDRE